MADDQFIKVGKAKGRPMLTWVGKKPLTQVRAYPAQKVESFSAGDDVPLADIDWGDWPDKFERGGLLFHGDNKDVLAYLLANGFRGKVKLIYIDPPFDSGADYVRKVQLRGVDGTQKVDGEEYSLGEQIQYTDIWANDNYLQFMYERLLMLRELLADDGSIYLHCDYRRSAQLKIVMDEVFGADNFINEIVWVRTNSHNMRSKGYVRSNDHILFFSKSSDFIFNEAFTEYGESQLNEYRADESGRLYTTRDLTFSTVNPNRQFEWRGTKPPAHRSWGASLEQLEEWLDAGKIILGKDGTPREPLKNSHTLA